MRTKKHYKLLFVSLFMLIISSVNAESWRDKTELLIYSPYYFGPNAFPIPELRAERVGSRFEFEVRGEYHYYTGDKTKDLFLRALVPIVKGKVGIEVSFVVKEHYKMTPETRDERNAVETKSPITCRGDVLISSFYQILTSDKWVDVIASFNLRTASGGRLCDARYTDAAAYWFDATIGKNLYKNEENNLSLRVQSMIGFYCWMTNDLIHRQNDAITYGGGLGGTYRNFSLSTDISGFSGYKHNGDHPLIWRNKLNYEYKKNIISARYNHGMKDRLYETYSLGYIRCF